MKYRVWDNENNCYYEPTYEAYKGNLEELLLSPAGQLSMRTYSKMIHESMFPDRFVIEFCAGLKDKSGKDIYEGCKCKIEYYNHSSPNYIKEQVVVFKHCTFWLIDLDYNEDLDVENYCSDRRMTPLYEFASPSPNRIEIIGTIHD